MNLFCLLNLSASQSFFRSNSDAYLAVTNLVKDQKEDHVKRLAEFAIDAVQAASELPLDEEDPNQHFVRALHACKRAGDFEALCAQLGAERLATLQEVAVEVEQQASQALV